MLVVIQLVKLWLVCFRDVSSSLVLVSPAFVLLLRLKRYRLRSLPSVFLLLLATYVGTEEVSQGGHFGSRKLFERRERP